MKIILKSASPRRKELLTKAGFSFEVVPAEVDESIDFNKTPYENVLELGLKKALADKEKFPNDILLGCDTIVVYENKIYGKPKDEKDAYETLYYVLTNICKILAPVAPIISEKVYKALTDKESVLSIILLQYQLFISRNYQMTIYGIILKLVNVLVKQEVMLFKE